MHTARRRNWLAFLRDNTFRSLRHRDYRLYFAGQGVSFTGSWVQSTALMWSVYTFSGNDPIWPPLILVATIAPTLLFGAVGGALADRFAKRPLILVCQALFLVNALLLAGLVWFGLATPPVALALAAMNGLVQAVDLPARLAFVPELIPKDDLVNAVGLNSLLFNLGRAIGPAIAGLAFLLCGLVVEGSEATRVGAAVCFILNAASYAAVIVGLLAMRAAVVGPRKKGGRLSEGLVLVWRNRSLAAVLGCTFALSVFGWPLLTLFPAFTRTVLNQGDKEYSTLVSALGGGALVAALANATFGRLSLARSFLAIGSALTALGLVGVTLSSALWPAAVCSAVFGLGMILFLSTGQSVLQLSTPDHARGRVMALWPMTLSGGSVLGQLVFGWAAKHFPIPAVLGVMAAGVGLTAASVGVLAWALRGTTPNQVPPGDPTDGTVTSEVPATGGGPLPG
ncbi:MAG: MFS transporter [Fimbriiglobus sp.]|jgi:MFS family permease|nr:MFS transporter [Fimbriiglobus sp.]